MTAQTRNELIRLAILASTVGFGFLLAQTALPATSPAQWIPSQADLDSALSNAAREWGTTPPEPVQIKAERASACGVLQSEARQSLPHPTKEADLAGGVAMSNLIQYTERWIPDPDETVTSTFTPDGGTTDTWSAKTTSEAIAAPTVSYEWLIRINTACTFLTPEILAKFVLHEYGHTLRLEHSPNEHSIMYWLVFLPAAEKKFGAQSITDADRKRVRVEVSAAAAR